MKERTFGIIKPNATGRNLIGPIVERISEEGFEIVGLRLAHLSQKEAEGFYAEHSERPFFPDLISFMTSGPVVLFFECRWTECDNGGIYRKVGVSREGVSGTELVPGIITFRSKTGRGRWVVRALVAAFVELSFSAAGMLLGEIRSWLMRSLP